MSSDRSERLKLVPRRDDADYQWLKAEVARLEHENLKLWGRDHARGHRFTRECPVCRRFPRESRP